MYFVSTLKNRHPACRALYRVLEKNINTRYGYDARLWYAPVHARILINKYEYLLDDPNFTKTCGLPRRPPKAHANQCFIKTVRRLEGDDYLRVRRFYEEPIERMSAWINRVRA